jgi:hypothetical protein
MSHLGTCHIYRMVREVFLLMYEKVYADQHNECCGSGASEVKRD